MSNNLTAQSEEILPRIQALSYLRWFALTLYTDLCTLYEVAQTW